MLFNKLALPAFIAVTAGYAAACPYLKGANSASSDCDTEAQVQRALQSSFRYGRFFDVDTVPPSGTLVHEYIEQASPGEGSYMDEAARSSRGSLILDKGELFTEYRLRGIESSVSFRAAFVYVWLSRHLLYHIDQSSRLYCASIELVTLAGHRRVHLRRAAALPRHELGLDEPARCRRGPEQDP